MRPSAVGWPQTGRRPFESELRVLTVVKIEDLKMCGLCKLSSHIETLGTDLQPLLNMVAPTTGALAPYRGPGTDSPELHLVGNVFHSDADRGMPWSEMGWGLRAIF